MQGQYVGGLPLELSAGQLAAGALELTPGQLAANAAGLPLELTAAQLAAGALPLELPPGAGLPLEMPAVEGEKKAKKKANNRTAGAAVAQQQQVGAAAQVGVPVRISGEAVFLRGESETVVLDRERGVSDI